MITRYEEDLDDWYREGMEENGRKQGNQSGEDEE